MLLTKVNMKGFFPKQDIHINLWVLFYLLEGGRGNTIIEVTKPTLAYIGNWYALLLNFE